MRFDTPVYFQRITPGEYDPATGNYGEDTVKEALRWASVTSSGAETLRLVYGTLRQDSLTVRLQTPYSGAYDRLRIGKRFYQTDLVRTLRTKQTFIISEVQHGEA